MTLLISCIDWPACILLHMCDCSDLYQSRWRVVQLQSLLTVCFLLLSVYVSCNRQRCACICLHACPAIFEAFTSNSLTCIFTMYDVPGLWTKGCIIFQLVGQSCTELKIIEKNVCLLTLPFTTDIVTVPARLLLQLIDMQIRSCFQE